MPEPGSGETCWSLVQRAAAGDDLSRSEFGQAYQPLIRSYLAGRWRGTRLVTEIGDVVQDVFVECFRRGGPLERADAAKGDFRGFLFGVVRNVAQRTETKARARRSMESLGSEPPDDGDRASELFDREWAHMLMRKAGELMAQQAGDEGARLRVELLRLRFGSDLPIREIAARWAMDLPAVHRMYARAREEFRTCLRSVVRFHAVRTEQQLDDECRRLLDLL